MQVESIAEQLFFSTVRVDTKYDDGIEGAGTAFLYAHHLDHERQVAFVVTNKHVVQGAQEGALTFHRKDGNRPQLGNGFQLDISNWQQVWFGHPDADVDIAISPFLPMEQFILQTEGVELFYRAVGSAMLPNQRQIDQLDAIETVTFIGYPNGMWDTVNQTPIARRGTTATPISLDFDGTPRFLVDASVFGGSSGSPVFILNTGMVTDKRGVTSLGSRLLFVGVIAAVYFREDINKIVDVPIPVQTEPMALQREMIDLGIVFKSRTVVETIEAFMKERGIV
ncbi:MAG: trypsin-like peptidase domain-containing protein [Anaerolineales bacterium]|nr:trypsin-like peptidase domain-containing protein [Anaerolineales bacterium]